MELEIIEVERVDVERVEVKRVKVESMDVERVEVDRLFFFGHFSCFHHVMYLTIPQLLLPTATHGDHRQNLPLL